MLPVARGLDCLINLKDLGEAIGIAARHPGARLGIVEIRPVMELPSVPSG